MPSVGPKAPEHTAPFLHPIPSHLLYESITDNMTRFNIQEIQTKPYEGQKPGTSGLRKRYESYVIAFCY
jgi:hypothetical protein